MGMDTNTPIFDNVSFSDIAKEIYTKKKEKDVQIQGLIQELKPLIKNISDAAMLVPLLKEYMEIAVKNDEVLVKLSSILQKLIVADSNNTDSGGEFGLTDAEKKQLLMEANDLKKSLFGGE
jgi:hypothetical protein